jgi:uncharacterized protein YcfL
MWGSLVKMKKLIIIFLLLLLIGCSIQKDNTLKVMDNLTGYYNLELNKTITQINVSKYSIEQMTDLYLDAYEDKNG